MNKQTLLSKVFMWMFIGLFVTFLTGYVVSLNPNMLLSLFGGVGYVFCVIAELLLVIFLSARISKMSPTTAKVSFLLYSFVTGLTFASIFIVYELTSIIYVFLITALVFGVFAFIGATTKLDLTKTGTYLLMALLSVLICVLLNMFIKSSSFDFVISVISVLIFIGFTAYDVQRVLKLYDNNVLPEENLAIYGALDLYLDFINIFLELLKFFGKNND